MTGGGKDMFLVEVTVLGVSVCLNFPSFAAKSTRSVLASDVVLPITATCDVDDVTFDASGTSGNVGGFTSELSSTLEGTVSSILHTILLVPVVPLIIFTSLVVVPLSADIVVPIRVLTFHVVVPLTGVVPKSLGLSSQNSLLPT